MSTAGQRRRMFFKSVKKNTRLILKSKLGVAGLAIILFFLILAVFAPYLTSNDPIYGVSVSSPYSYPQWATIFPRYQDLAATSYPLQGVNFGSQADLHYWTITGSNYTLGTEVGLHVSNANKSVTALEVNQSFVPSPANTPGGLIPAQLLYGMSQSFAYTTKPPTSFVITALVKPLSLSNVTDLYLNFVLSTATHNYTLGSVTSYTIRSQIQFTQADVGNWRALTLSSGLLPTAGNPDFPITANPATIVFANPGTYRFTFQLLAVGNGKNASYSVEVGNLSFQIVGRTYGILGTDIYGLDVWSQFVWGSRISFLVGVLSALGSVGIGTLTGLAAGLIGGWVDEVISRTTDFFLVIPFLPLVIVVVFFIGSNQLLYKGIYYWIIVIFVALSWPTITRIVRSQVLSVKERQFVLASRALGGESWYIMRKHILPNVLGLVYAQAALLVPGFILTEAALDYLAISLHPINTITWGIMLTNALNSAALTSAAVDYAWWWFLPPGIAIALLSLAFVMVGFALDQVFNPKLRER